MTESVDKRFSLGVMAAVFYFMPFVITVLTVVGVPLIGTIGGQ